MSASVSPSGSPAFVAPDFLRFWALRSFFASSVKLLSRTLISSSSQSGFFAFSIGLFMWEWNAARACFDVQTVSSVCRTVSVLSLLVAVVSATLDKNEYENM